MRYLQLINIFCGRQLLLLALLLLFLLSFNRKGFTTSKIYWPCFHRHIAADLSRIVSLYLLHSIG